MLLLLSAAGSTQERETEGCDQTANASFRQQAHDALSLHQNDTAVRKFQQALMACPADRAVLLNLAGAYLAVRDFNQAISSAAMYLKAEPSSVPGHVMLANAYFMAQRFQEATEESDRALRVEPGQPAALKIKGNVDYLLGSFEEAKDIFIELIDQHPKDEDSPYMLGRMYYQEGDIDHAMGQFERVIKLNPRSYKAFDNLGLCYEAKGQSDAAIRYFLTSIKIVQKDDPAYDWAYANLADLLIKQGNNRKGFDAASMAADRNPSSARNFYLGGKALVNLGKNDLALNWLERSAALDPGYPQPLYLLVRVYHKLGMEEKSAEAQRKFVAAQAKVPGVRR